MLRQSWMFVPAAEGEVNLVDSTISELFRLLPGVLRLEQGTVSSSSTGEIRVASVIDVYFADEDAMNSAYASPEGKRISREVMNNTAAVLDVLTFDAVRILLQDAGH